MGYGGEMSPEQWWSSDTYWSFNTATQKCCYNQWMEAVSTFTQYYYDFYFLETAYDADGDPLTLNDPYTGQVHLPTLFDLIKQTDETCPRVSLIAPTPYEDCM